MQLVQLLTYGKLKEPYLRAACAEYEKRLSRFCKLQCVELEPVSLPERPSEKEIAAALEKEAQPLLKRKKAINISRLLKVLKSQKVNRTCVGKKLFRLRLR